MPSSCLVCGSPSTDPLTAGRRLRGGTSRADSLHEFTLAQCPRCGHIQKVLDAAWQDCMRDLYAKHYDLGARHVKVDGFGAKIVSRRGVVIQKRGALVHHKNRGSVLDFGWG